MLVLGDVNIHVDSPDCSLSTDLADILENFGLEQHVDFATHNKKPNTLELVCNQRRGSGQTGWNYARPVPTTNSSPSP